MDDVDAAEALRRRMEADASELRRLLECPGPHDFVPALPDERLPWQGVFVCTRCSGRMRAEDKQWYDQGLAHGRKSVSPE